MDRGGVSLEALRILLKQSGKSPCMVSREAGLDPRYVSLLLAWTNPRAKRKKNPSTVEAGCVVKLARAFNTSSAVLLGEQEAPKTPAGLPPAPPDLEFGGAVLPKWLAPITKEERQELKEQHMNCESILTYADRCLSGSYLPEKMRDWLERQTLVSQGFAADEIDQRVQRYHESSDRWFQRRQKAPFHHTFLVCEEDFREAARCNRGWICDVINRLDEIGRSTSLAISRPGAWCDVTKSIANAARGFSWHCVVVYDAKTAVVQQACHGQWFQVSDQKLVESLRGALSSAVRGQAHESAAKALSDIFSTTRKKPISFADREGQSVRD